MDALLMCGGQGTRLDAAVEKPLYEVDGVPLIDAVLDALASSRIDDVHAVVSPHVPDTTRHLRARGVDRIDTPGDGYVPDLQTALADVGPPVLTVAADLPLLTGPAIDRVLDRFDGTAAVQVSVPAALKRRLGVSVETTYESDGREIAPTGVNVVTAADAETVYLTYNVRYAINVNRPADATVAEALR